MITKLAVFTPFFSSIFESKSWTDRKNHILSSLYSWKKIERKKKIITFVTIRLFPLV